MTLFFSCPPDIYETEEIRQERLLNEATLRYKEWEDNRITINPPKPPNIRETHDPEIPRYSFKDGKVVFVKASSQACKTEDPKVGVETPEMKHSFLVDKRYKCPSPR